MDLTKRLPPGLALLFLGPVLGELLSGHQSLFEFINPLNFVLTALPYGFAAIICRELVVRWRKGWASLVLLGLAFGIYEEFIVARSVWDPNWAELGVLGNYSYWQGITWTYAEVLIHFHLTISILSSVVLAGLLYPQRWDDRWVSNRGLIACLIGLALWTPVLMILHPFSPPLIGYALSWAAIAGLVYLAWRLPGQVFKARPGVVVAPFWYGLIACGNMTLVFWVVFLLPESNPAWLPAWPLAFALVAFLDLGAFWVVLLWSGNGSTWDARDKLALIIGMLALFIVLDVFKDFSEAFGGSSIVAIVALWGLWRLWLHTGRARLRKAS